MYRIKASVDLKVLEKYGFKIGRNIPDNEKCICNDHERDDYWLIPMNPDEPDEVHYADEDYDQPIWSVHVQSHRRLWIDCVPSCTYHIDNADMEEMFYALKCMIEDGIIEDDYKAGEHLKEFIESQPSADVPDTNVGEWIPCSERLPDESMDSNKDGIVTVLATWEFGGMWFNGCSYCDVIDYDLEWNSFIISEGKKVTAWKPVEPYKGE